jgi:hypothetical protein
MIRPSFSSTGFDSQIAMHRRHEGQRQDKGEGQRDDHGQRHRGEGLALDAGQREQRDIDEDDDGLSVNGRPDHLARRRGDDVVEPLVTVERRPSWCWRSPCGAAHFRR